MGTLAVDNIQHTDGSSAVTLNNAGITNLSAGTISSGVIFPAGHIIDYTGQNQTVCIGSIVTSSSLGDVINSGVEITIGSGNKALILVNGFFYSAINGSTSDRQINLYKVVDGGSDQSMGVAWRGGEVMAQYERQAATAMCLDNSTGTVTYKLKVSSLGTAGNIYYYTNMFVFEIKG